MFLLSCKTQFDHLIRFTWAHSLSQNTQFIKWRIPYNFIFTFCLCTSSL